MSAAKRRRYTRLTGERRAQVRQIAARLYLEGLSRDRVTAALAADHGVQLAPNTVTRLLREAGVEIGAPSRHRDATWRQDPAGTAGRDGSTDDSATGGDQPSAP